MMVLIDGRPGSVRASRRSVGGRPATPAAAAIRNGDRMPTGLATPSIRTEALAVTEEPGAEVGTVAVTPVPAPALTEEQADTAAAREPIAETRVLGTALGKGTKVPRASA